MKLFQERLKLLREQHGYKQDFIAKKLNITTSAYGYYEQGRNEPALETIVKLANIFDVSIDYLLGHNSSKQVRNSQVSEGIALYQDELAAIEALKETGLLRELCKSPKANTERLARFWFFVKNEIEED
ncbi:DNA-binding transcriptional regulator, XRE-family HTH domain [Amphibacillus marinus]|uniref:DNA-binding transcriptional regulator, XRE-family HTH domain n=1 Tax=Amphibacillus marinus TaxID=872970 RepID=A0A1H8N9A2_9BACI|nr:helix-turn-helix transcriptional regulator [Amphibacillus marinus]SEO26174.1 DNA-binding transcriptional regulator, XRE-family HTH domain [Amphibacillus marinus]